MTPKEAEARNWLGAFVIPIAAASLVMVFVVLHENRQGASGIALLFLLPAVFSLHVTEEFIWPGGFISWDNIFRPQYAGTAGSFYVRINAIPAVGFFLGALLAMSNPTRFLGSFVPTWLTMSTFMCWNAIFHLRGALRTHRYSPGMVTGLALFFPLTLVAFICFLRAGLPPVAAVLSGAAAFAVQPILNLAKGFGQKKAA